MDSMDTVTDSATSTRLAKRDPRQTFLEYRDFKDLEHQESSDAHSQHSRTSGTLLDSGSKQARSRHDEDFEDDDDTFGDGDCGEPIRGQHLVLDFTPTEEDQDPELQQKIIDFWAFINKNPHLGGDVVKPKEESAHGYKTETKSVDTLIGDVYDTARKPEAVKLLEYAINRGAMDSEFPSSTVDTLVSSSHRNPMSEHLHLPFMKSVTSGSKSINKSSKKIKKSQPNPEVVSLMDNMDKWDAAHPKSLDPPGPPPTLQDCVLQRVPQ